MCCKEPGEFRTWLCSAHECLPYKKSLDSRGSQPPHMLGRQYPALSHCNSRRRNKASEHEARFEPRLEGAQISVVDADERSREPKSQVKLAAIVHLDQHGHAKRFGRRLELLHARQLKSRDDEKDAIGAQSARLEDLIRIDDEILAEHRKLAGIARGGEVLGGALEEAPVGEHRKTGRPMLRVGARDRGGIEWLPQHTLARARLLDLGDDRGQAGGDFIAQSPRKIPGLLRVFRAAPHGSRADRPLRFRDFLGLDGENPRQNVSHARAVA